MKKNLLRLSTLCLMLLVSIVGRAGNVTAVWDFHNADGNYYAQGSANIQKTTGPLDATADDGSTISLFVDASNNGKLYSRGNGDAQFNNGTIIRVPVKSEDDEVTVVSYPGYHNYTVAGTAAANDTETYKALASDAKAGYVEIVATATSYLYSIKVVQKAGSSEGTAPLSATWDFGNADVMAATLALSASATPGDVLSVEKTLSMTVVSNGAAFRNNGNNIQVRNGAEFRIPVQSTKDVITVKGYPGYSYYKYNDGDEIKNTNDAPQSTYTASASDVKRGYVSVVSTNDNNYYYSINVVQSSAEDGNLVEKSIYSTDFSDWEKAKASDPATVVEKKTKFTKETLKFTLYKTEVMATEDTKFSNYTTLPRMTVRAEKDAGSYIVTSPLSNITKIRFIHGATGSNRGWKVEAKGDGDEDWVVISGDVANPAAWCEVTKPVNKKNVQLRFTNLADSQNAYLFDLEIFGSVDLSDAPLLGSFKANGKTYKGDDFEMNNDGAYEGTFELFKSETMISSENPLSDVVADNGEIGTVTYVSGENSCKVTIPVTAKGQTVNYIANFIRKPFLTLTYVGLDGKEIGTQKVEKDTKIGTFEKSIADVACDKEGFKARGWFKQNYVGAKYTIESVVTEDIKLYAVATEIEVASLSRKYEFNLKDKNFDPVDHEAFNPTGGEFHDTTHGWVFSNGNTIDVLVGPKASVSFTICKFSAKDAKLKIGDTELAAYDETDGKLVSYTHDGEAGTLTFTVSASGSVYIHSVKIANTSEANYSVDGNKYTVKAGDASSFLDALDAANGVSGTDEVMIYLPNGTYDLGNTCLTTIGRDNIKISGESQNGVVIQNTPVAEGIGVTATLLNTSQYLTLENLTLKNAYPYYDPATGKAAGSAGRAVCLQDKGNYTVCKNVTMLSYQDTYYSSNNNGYFYFANCDIHGLVDFVCGGGDVFFENTTFTLESREMTEGKGDVTIAAPNSAKQYGYVMSNCVIDCKSASFNWGRAWDAPSRLAWLNTTLKQPEKIISTRFTPAGMNVAADKFYEYKTVDEAGNVVSPATNVIKFTHDTGNKEYETILTDAEAEGYSKAKVFAGTPDEFKTRVGANTDGIESISTAKAAQQQADAIYTLQGVRVSKATKGIYIVNGKKVVMK